jgi:hypothetical protein
MLRQLLEIGRELPDAPPERAAVLHERSERISARLARNSRRLFR